jgi:hypothetical protein
VASLEVRNVVFTPRELSSRQGSDELAMAAQDAGAAGELKPERGVAAKLTLKDGRILTVSANIDAARPKALLIGKSVQPSALGTDSNIQLADSGELPLDATLVFSIRAQTPAIFARDETVEVATADESTAVSLSVAGGTLALENSRVALATLDPRKAFGASSYGPLKVRVNAKGATSDWQPLATLVRLPALKALECPAAPEVACKLSGSDLYLIDSVAGTADFSKPVIVPDGFLGTTLPVPHPSTGTLYLKLRDDPQVINPTRLVALGSQARAAAADNQGPGSDPY